MALYRKTYLCVCEGQQEEMYLKHLSSLLKQMPLRVVTFNTTEGNAKKLIKNYTEYDNACLFDYDFNDSEFKENIEICNDLHRTGQKTKNGKKVFHAFSSVNFDLWLILHKEDFNRQVSNNGAYVTAIRRIYNLPTTADIKTKPSIEKILGQISLDDIKKAIERADRIRSAKLHTDRRFIGSTEYYDNPDFSLHEFLKVVLKDCGEL
ncbi:MAG: RloB domain-containing protein [Herbinix sp.]|nr:RloB domain-containing protein [Herbinix sp.]